MNIVKYMSPHDHNDSIMVRDTERSRDIMRYVSIYSTNPLYLKMDYVFVSEIMFLSIKEINTIRI